ncbi:CAI-1 autoinducer synthase [Paraburkholderia xenovorans LB400]|uniref:Aminotransferase n=1 Tax=Paraburkholderia xenovorans (strain LB400) TaxID=266265 RepID=Q13IZ6_PARXL|nr:alpha-hydroxyketone-type quorum-sensing autoinducer synthase [Paraburkholderia xenovorans]ABE35943.1 Putative aminotransferase [Paraburkholderia xenovorans LB400]AIP34617.1 CAI-1 autoinducer synthase [Paraburkholderia xenovorans LB400]
MKSVFDRTKQRHSRPALPAFVTSRVERYYRERVQETWGGGHIMRGRIAGPDALHLSSNDYLAIARHPDIIGSMAATLLENGNGLLMSGIFLHGDCPQLQFENRLATFMQAEAGVLCQSGYAANTGLIQSIASEQTPVYIDMMAHMSLWEGVRSAGAVPVAFRHNDAAHLEQQIGRYGQGIVLVDSVYSTTGSVCRLVSLADVCERHACVFVVDESHSLGTHGPRGAGLVVELGLQSRVAFRTASLAKAFAGRAGFISCPVDFQEYFKFESNPAIFSSTLLPHEISGLDATLSVIECADRRRTRLASSAAWLRQRLTELGYNLNGSRSQIIALEAGTEQRTIVLRDALESRGIFGSVFCAPATARNRALIRLSIHAALSDAQVEKIASVCRDIRSEVELDKWPSTRRLGDELSARRRQRETASEETAVTA